MNKLRIDTVILLLVTGCASAPPPAADEPTTATEPTPSPPPHPPTRLDAPDTRDSEGLAVPQQFSDKDPEKAPPRECAFKEFADKFVDAEMGDPLNADTQLLGDINGDTLPDYSVTYADKVVIASWVFVQQAEGDCWRKVYNGAGFIQVGTDTSGGWKTFEVPFAANSLAGHLSEEYVQGTAIAEYDADKGRYMWTRPLECKNGKGRTLTAKECTAVFDQLKPKD